MKKSNSRSLVGQKEASVGMTTEPKIKTRKKADPSASLRASSAPVLQKADGLQHRALRNPPKVHRPDRLLFPFPRAMLTVEIFAMEDEKQRPAATCPARPNRSASLASRA